MDRLGSTHGDCAVLLLCVHRGIPSPHGGDLMYFQRGNAVCHGIRQFSTEYADGDLPFLLERLKCIVNEDVQIERCRDWLKNDLLGIWLLHH